MTDYTPTTEVIRHALAFPRERLGEPRPIKPEAFDRWLEQVKAEAWDEGFADGGQSRSTGLEKRSINYQQSIPTGGFPVIVEVSMLQRTTEHTRIASFRDGDTVGYIFCMECSGTGWWGYGPTLSTNGPCIECKGQGRVLVGLQ